MDGKQIYNKLSYLQNYNLPIKNLKPSKKVIDEILIFKDNGYDITEQLKKFEPEIFKGALLTNQGIIKILYNNKKAAIKVLKLKKVQEWINQKS